MYKNLLKKIRERAILKRIFLSTFGISVFFITCICIICFSWLQSLTEKDVTQNEHRILAHYNLVFDNYISSARQSVETLYKNVYVTRAIVTNQMEWNDNMSVVAHTILNVIKVNPRFDSIYVIGTEGILLKSTSYVIPPKNNIEKLVTQIFSSSYKKRINTWSYMNLYGKEEQLLCVAMGESNGSGVYTSGIAVNINVGNIIDEVFQQVEDSGSYFIMDSKGIILGEAGGQFEFEQKINDTQLLEAIISQEKATHTVTMNYNGEKYLISSMISKDYDYYIVHMLPYRYVASPVIRVRNAMILCGVLMTMISLCLSGYVAIKVYHPIDEVVDHLNASQQPGNDDHKKNKNELAVVSTTISKMVERLNDYSKEMKTDQMVRYFLSKYNKPCIPKAFLEAIEFEEPNALYSVAVIRVCNEEAFLNQNNEEAIAFQLESICTIAINAYQEVSLTKAYIIDQEYIVLILLSKEGLLSFQEIEQVASAVLQLISDLVLLKVNIGISEINDNLNEMRQSYGIAKAATNYRFLFGENRVITQKKMESCVLNDGAASDMKPLVEAAKASDEYAFIKQYEALEMYIMSYSLQTAYDLLITLAYDLYLFLHEMNPNKTLSYENAKSEILEFKYLSEAKVWFLELFYKIKDVKNQIQSTGAPEIVVNAISYINNHFSNVDLNAQFLANKYNISPSYFSRIFNEYTNCAFPDYLGNIRLEHAKELLMKDLNKSIQEICEVVGYSNSSYFTASFKKRYGITPSKYRLKRMIE